MGYKSRTDTGSKRPGLTNYPRYGLTPPAVFLSEGASLLPNPTLRSNANLPTCKYFCSRAFGRRKQCPIATMTIHHGPKTANPCKSAADKMLACSFPQTRSVPSWRCSKKTEFRDGEPRADHQRDSCQSCRPKIQRVENSCIRKHHMAA